MAHILVIEDDKPVRNMLRNLLEGEGHQVIEACEGDEGLQLYRAQSPDLVITDIHMPGKDGLEVIKEVRADAPEAKIIAIAAHVLEMLPRAKELGADRTIGKPFDVNELLEMVEGLLGRE